MLPTVHFTFGLGTTRISRQRSIVGTASANQVTRFRNAMRRFFRHHPRSYCLKLSGLRVPAYNASALPTRPCLVSTSPRNVQAASRTEIRSGLNVWNEQSMSPNAAKDRGQASLYAVTDCESARFKQRERLEIAAQIPVRQLETIDRSSSCSCRRAVSATFKSDTCRCQRSPGQPVARSSQQ